MILPTACPADWQVEENALMAAATLLPHRLLMWACTLDASLPQMVARSAGLGSVLLVLE